VFFVVDICWVEGRGRGEDAREFSAFLGVPRRENNILFFGVSPLPSFTRSPSLSLPLLPRDLFGLFSY